MGSTPVAVSANLAGLAPATTYTITLAASSAQGTSSGSPVTFATAASGPGAGAGALTVGGLKLSSTRFRRGKRAATLATSRRKALPSATTISFALSEAATVTLTLRSGHSAGVLVGHMCLARSQRPPQGRPCTCYLPTSGAVRRSAHAGTDRIRFYGVLDRRATSLAPGGSLSALAAAGTAPRRRAPRPPAAAGPDVYAREPRCRVRIGFRAA